MLPSTGARIPPTARIALVAVQFRGDTAFPSQSPQLCAWRAAYSVYCTPTVYPMCTRHQCRSECCL